MVQYKGKLEDFNWVEVRSELEKKLGKQAASFSFQLDQFETELYKSYPNKNIKEEKRSREILFLKLINQTYSLPIQKNIHDFMQNRRDFINTTFGEVAENMLSLIYEIIPGKFTSPYIYS